MAELSSKLMRSAPDVPWPVVVALAAVNSAARTRLLDTLRFEDLAGDPSRFGALDAMGEQGRISWVTRNVGPGENLDVWLGNIDRSDAWVGTRVELMATVENAAAHVLEYLIAGLSADAAHTLVTKWQVPEQVREAAFARLLELTGAGELAVATRTQVRARLLCEGAREPGRWVLLQMEASELRAGSGDATVGNALCAEVCDPATAPDVCEVRAGELANLAACVPQHLMTLRWALEVTRSGIDLMHPSFVPLRAALFTFQLPWDGAPALTDWVGSAASEDPGVLTGVVAELCEVARSDLRHQTVYALRELVMHLSYNLAVPEAVWALLTASFPDALRSAAREGAPLPTSVLAELVDELNVESLLEGRDHRVVVPALLGRASLQLVAQLLSRGYLVPGDAELLRADVLAHLESPSAEPLFAWVAARLGDDPGAWQLFDALATGTGEARVGDLLAMVDAATAT